MCNFMSYLCGIKYKYLTLFAILIASTTVYSQDNFSKGYDVGFKKGYCHSRGIGCLPPTTPMAPLPILRERFDSYSDGYNRGFVDGLNVYQYEGKKNNPFRGNEIRGSVSPQFGDLNLYTPDYEHLNKVYKSAQDKINTNRARVEEKNSINDMSSKVIEKYKEYMSEGKVDARKSRIKEIFLRYNSFPKYPNRILNGIHKATLIKGDSELYENCIVQVYNNNIVYVSFRDYQEFDNFFLTEGFYPLDFYEDSFCIERIASGTLNSGKATITISSHIPVLKETNKFKFEVLLLDYVERYNSHENGIKKVRGSLTNNQLSKSTGWYKGHISDRNTFCETRDIYLVNGVVKKWIANDGSEIKVDSGGLLIEGRTTVSIIRPPYFQNLPNSPLGKNSFEIYDIYLVEQN